MEFQVRSYHRDRRDSVLEGRPRLPWDWYLVEYWGLFRCVQDAYLEANLSLSLFRFHFIIVGSFYPLP
jgi:hypothetical protein